MRFFIDAPGAVSLCSTLVPSLSTAPPPPYRRYLRHSGMLQLHDVSDTSCGSAAPSLTAPTTSPAPILPPVQASRIESAAPLVFPSLSPSSQGSTCAGSATAPPPPYGASKLLKFCFAHEHNLTLLRIVAEHNAHRESCLSSGPRAQHVASSKKFSRHCEIHISRMSHGQYGDGM